ncbi:hypothetical protein [Aestuariivirga sp.]|uniref:hypothetical protein n=1 Tax=Aestuariivirga sp. TaxID=2650926 RepID=UPI003BAABB03
MKSYCSMVMIMLVRMGVLVDFIAAGQDEDAALYSDDVDGCAIEPRQDGRGIDLFHLSDRRDVILDFSRSGKPTDTDVVGKIRSRVHVLFSTALIERDLDRVCQLDVKVP